MQRISYGGHEEQALWIGGDGSPVVLLHGGWAGASAHWSSIWDVLAADHRVIAPELPGIATADVGWTAYDQYVEWLKQLLSARGIERAVVVGNSFGATLAYLLALRSPERCSGLVMVDGFPPPELLNYQRP